MASGSLLITEARQGEIRLRPALIMEPEIWSQQRRAYFMLMGCVTKEEWDEMAPDVIAMGLDPNNIEDLGPNRRDSLPTDAEWNARMKANGVDAEKLLRA